MYGGPEVDWECATAGVDGAVHLFGVCRCVLEEQGLCVSGRVDTTQQCIEGTRTRLVHPVPRGMCRACADDGSQYILVDETPVQVDTGVRFERVLQKLDVDVDSAGIYTDKNGERKVLPPEAIVSEHVPPNTAVVVAPRVKVEKLELFESGSLFGERLDQDAEPNLMTVVVEGEDITIDDETTAGEVKRMIGAGEYQVLTFQDEDDRPVSITDDEMVADYVNPGTQLVTAPDRTGF